MNASVTWICWHGLLWIVMNDRDWTERKRSKNTLRVTDYWSEAGISFWAEKKTPSIVHGDDKDHHLLTFTNKKNRTFSKGDPKSWSFLNMRSHLVFTLFLYIFCIFLTKCASSNFGGVTLILIRPLLHVCACLFWGTQFFAERSKGSYIAIAMATGDETRHAETELWKSDIHSDFRGGIFHKQFWLKKWI